jgi:sulfatase maturation enzyme AslB (radical SAM superfamily)
MKKNGLGVNKLTTPEYIHHENKESDGGKLWSRYSHMIESTVLDEKPPFPRAVLVEIVNACNHKCTFCAYQKMTRPSKNIDSELLRSVATQAYVLGAREIGLHGASEPMMCRQLEQHIKTCADIGYEYIYFTTNGSLGNPERWKNCIDAGLHSVKFSINGGTRDVYKKVHGRDDFDKVIESVKFISEYRKSLDRPLYLAVSFVETRENRESFQALKSLVKPLVDEVFHAVASNQSGQMGDLDISPTIPEVCHIPFNQLNITREGYLRGCCNDYQNMLVLEDLTKVPLEDAWLGEHATKLRSKHLRGQLGSTLCQNCIHGTKNKVIPIRGDLSPWDPID